MRRLCANKTKLYRLVAGFEPLPPMRKVTFVKAYRQPGYWLRWGDGEGMLCKAFLDTCAGKPLLSIEKEEFCGPARSRVVHGLNVDDLARRGMVEEIATKEERRRAEAAKRGDSDFGKRRKEDG